MDSYGEAFNKLRQMLMVVDVFGITPTLDYTLYLDINVNDIFRKVELGV